MRPCTRNGPTRVERHIAQQARRAARSAGTRARCRIIPIHNVKQRSLLRSRGALLRPGFAFLFSIRLHEGASGAPKGAVFLLSRVADARRSALTEARRASGGTRSPLGAPPWRFWAGGRASFSGISSGSVERALRSQVVVPGGRGPEPPGAKRLRAAAAGRHSPLRLRHVSGDGPSDERGYTKHGISPGRSQYYIHHVFVISFRGCRRPHIGATASRRFRERSAAAGRVASPGPADGSHLAAASAVAEEPFAAVGLEPRHACSMRHLDPLQHLSRSRIDPPHIALVTFPGAVPELAVDPGDPGHDAVGLDGAEYRPGLGIDLMDLPAAMLPHPERPFGPRQPRIAAAAGRRDRGEHAAGLRIDLLDAVLGDLKQVPAVEGRSCVRGDSDGAQHLPARRIEGVQLVSGRKPDVLAVERNAVHVVNAGKGSIFTDDFGCRSFHVSPWSLCRFHRDMLLVARQWTRE